MQDNRLPWTFLSFQTSKILQTTKNKPQMTRDEQRMQDTHMRERRETEHEDNKLMLMLNSAFLAEQILGFTSMLVATHEDNKLMLMQDYRLTLASLFQC